MAHFDPAVFAVGNDYHIMLPNSGNTLFWVKVGQNTYKDARCGVMRSACGVHKVIVPMYELDAVGRYTVCEQAVLDRKPYFTALGEITEKEYDFRAVNPEHARAYHLADVHGKPARAIEAAQKFGKIDFLILNGDLVNHSGETELFDVIYEHTTEITHGRIPVVFARGNHDLRGAAAELLPDYTPCVNDVHFYSFRIGSIWGVILDCCEDKEDDHEEYNGAVFCHQYRQQQTAYLKALVRKADNEYLADGVRYRLVVCHNPFTSKKNPPFNIENALFGEWADLLRRYIHPDLMICGHDHRLQFNLPGCEADALGQPCTLVVGAVPGGDESYRGAGFDFRDGCIDVYFTDNHGAVLEQHTVRA